MNKFYENFILWIIQRRWTVIMFFSFLALIMSSGIRFLQFNNDTRMFFSEQNPQLNALEIIESMYTRDRTLVFVIAPKDKNVFTRKTLGMIEELTEKAWETPYSSRTDSITNFQHTYANDDELIVQNLVQNAKTLSQTDIEKIKHIALSEPLLVNRKISDSGHVSAIYVNILLPGKSTEEVATIARFAREIRETMRDIYPDIDIYLTGGIMFDNAFGETAKHDITRLVPIMGIILFIIIGYFLRSFMGTLITFIIIILSTLTGLGIAGWLGLTLNVVSSNAPIMILTLSVADCIHILTSLFNQMANGISKHEALKKSFRINLKPIFLTSITTIIGFLSMNLSDAPPFRHMGNIVAIGIAAAFIYSIFFLPAFIAVVPLNIKQDFLKKEMGFFQRLADIIISKKRFLWMAFIVLIGTLSIGTTSLELNDNFAKYFRKNSEIRKANDFVEKNLTGINLIEYSFSSGSLLSGIHDPAYLKTIDSFVTWYRKQPKVVHINTITDIVKRLNKNMNGDNEAYYTIPENKDLIAQYLLLYEISLPFGLDLNNRINIDKSASRITVNLRNMDTKEIRNTDKKARNWLRKNAPREMFTYGSGLSIMWAHISERNIKSMLAACIGILILISAILIITLGSIKLGLISLIPNILPLIMAFGIWGIFSNRVGLGLSTVTALSFGIVVDDTVHFLSKYLSYRRKKYKEDVSMAIRHAFANVGNAMWITSVSLVFGFLVLIFSEYKTNFDMGMLTAITITLALIMDMFFLPLLLMKFDKIKYTSNKEDPDELSETPIIVGMVTMPDNVAGDNDSQES